MVMYQTSKAALAKDFDLGAAVQDARWTQQGRPAILTAPYTLFHPSAPPLPQTTVRRRPLLTSSESCQPCVMMMNINLWSQQQRR
jgi:hypothetical protein